MNDAFAPNSDLAPEEIQRRLQEYDRMRKELEARDIASFQKAKEGKVEKRKYRSTMASVNYVFPSGKVAAFIRGKYETDRENEIEHLDALIDSGGTHHIRRWNSEDEAALTRVDLPEDVISALKAKFFQEFIELSQNGGPLRDMGTSDQSRVKPASSMDVAVAMAGGTGKTQMSDGLTAALERLKGNPLGDIKAVVDDSKVQGDHTASSGLAAIA